MTQLEKLVKRLKARPVEASFDDVRKVLEAYGWKLRNHSGSHANFKKPGDERLFTVPLVGGRRVKRVYLDLLCELLELDDED